MTHDRWNAFVDLDGETAAGAGPLSGIKIGIKSNIMVKGLPWTAGMGIHRDRIAPRDAEVVKRLRDAGGLILGTLNMHEAALGATTDNAFFGRTHNPHRYGYTPGGSSGGSGAAVAAGLCDVALGTDTLGSIRIPAAYCGVYGLKPTNGMVPSDGLAFLQPTLDCIGPLATSIDVIARVWPVLSQTQGPTQCFGSMLVLDDLAGVEVEPAVGAAYRRACAQMALKTAPFVLPHSISAIRRAGLAAAGRWLMANLGSDYASDNPGLSAELKFILSVCKTIELQPALLWDTRSALCDALGDDGVLIMPTTPQAAFAHGGRAPASQADFTALANIAGLPALSLPAGWSDDGLPVAVQLIGPVNSEARLIALASDLDAALGAYRQPLDFGKWNL